MKDRFQPEIGAAECDGVWASIDWKAAHRRVRNLRQRIFRATREKKWNQVRSLMKLMLRSQSNLQLSLRAATQINQGKRTPGIDGEVALTVDARATLYQEMKAYQPWRVKPVKRVYIPKANGKKRPLGIPVMRDRVLQGVVKNALEPSWEARFEASSYGFRPGRSVHDAIEHCHTLFNRRTHFHWVLDADIKGAFDNISHEFLLGRIGEAPGKALIKAWLKAGYVEMGAFHSTDTGTPQGGVASPLLANIALNGLEKFLNSFTDWREYEHWSKERNKFRIQKVKVPRYGFVRYADDFIIAGRSAESLEELLPLLHQWLDERGLKLNEDKTGIKHIEDGFNFLGFTIRRVGQNKCLTLPEKKKVLSFLQGINAWLKAHPDLPATEVIQHLNPRIRGFCNFYRSGVSGEVFNYMQHILWTHLWRWVKRRHPGKSRKWMASKYFDLPGWRFKAKGTDRAGRIITYRLMKPNEVKIIRHVKVKGDFSPDDPTLQSYWEFRNKKAGKTKLAKGSDEYRLAERQQWQCVECGTHLFNGEPLHIHHALPVKQGGKDTLDNMVLLHSACHYAAHLQL